MLPTTDFWDNGMNEQIDIKLYLLILAECLLSPDEVAQKGTTFLVIPVTTMLLALPECLLQDKKCIT